MEFVKVDALVSVVLRWVLEENVVVFAQEKVLALLVAVEHV